MSTIVFALKGTQDTSIIPDPHVVARIRHYCAAESVSLDTVTFLLDRPEYALPRLDSSEYNFALIDGRHGFRAPFYRLVLYRRSAV